MDRRLIFAAQEGDIEGLYTLIREDAHVLDSLDEVPFTDTPLHVASAAGQQHFGLEIMRLKPSFARKLNQAGFSPIHLALQNGQTQMVLRFLDFDRELVRVQGKEGLTPLHFAAKEEMVDLLAQLLVACPEAIQDLTIRKETALHTAAKHNKLEALKVLLGWLDYVGKNSVLDWTDDEGNNILHIAASRSQVEIVQILLKRRIEVNAKNLEGLTALDILQYQGVHEDKELKNLLRRTGAMNGSSLPRATELANYLKRNFSWHERSAIAHHREQSYMSNESRNAVLVVAILIATVTFQAMQSPPNKNWVEATSPFLSTNPVANDTSPSLRDPPLGSTIQWDNFYTFNHAAFFAAMAEINHHLKSQHVTVFQTLYIPLIFCYILLSIAVFPAHQLVGFIGPIIIIFFPKIILLFMPKELAVFKECIFRHCSSSHIFARDGVRGD